MGYLFMNHDMKMEDAEFRLPPLEIRMLVKGQVRLRDEWRLCKYCDVEPIVFATLGRNTVPLNSYGHVHCCSARPKPRKPQGTVYKAGKASTVAEALRIGERLPGMGSTEDEWDDRPY